MQQKIAQKRYRANIAQYIDFAQRLCYFIEKEGEVHEDGCIGLR